MILIFCYLYYDSISISFNIWYDVETKRKKKNLINILLKLRKFIIFLNFKNNLKLHLEEKPENKY